MHVVLGVYKVALAPLLLWQGHRLRRTALRLPEAQGPRAGRVADERVASVGNEPGSLKLLFVGDSSVAGVGVAHRRQALPWQAARLVSARLNLPVEYQLLARSGVNTRQCHALVVAARPVAADIVVIALGTNDVTTQCAPRKFIAHYTALVEYLRNMTGASGAVITGLPPMRILPVAPQPLRWYLGEYARRLDDLLRGWAAERNWARFLPLDWAAMPAAMAADGFHPGLGQYRHWAELVAGHIEALVDREPGLSCLAR